MKVKHQKASTLLPFLYFIVRSIFCLTFWFSFFICFLIGSTVEYTIFLEFTVLILKKTVFLPICSVCKILTFFTMMYLRMPLVVAVANATQAQDRLLKGTPAAPPQTEEVCKALNLVAASKKPTMLRDTSSGQLKCLYMAKKGHEEFDTWTQGDVVENWFYDDVIKSNGDQLECQEVCEERTACQLDVDWKGLQEAAKMDTGFDLDYTKDSNYNFAAAETIFNELMNKASTDLSYLTGNKSAIVRWLYLNAAAVMLFIGNQQDDWFANELGIAKNTSTIGPEASQMVYQVVTVVLQVKDDIPYYAAVDFVVDLTTLLQDIQSKAKNNQLENDLLRQFLQNLNGPLVKKSLEAAMYQAGMC